MAPFCPRHRRSTPAPAQILRMKVDPQAFRPTHIRAHQSLCHNCWDPGHLAFHCPEKERLCYRSGSAECLKQSAEDAKKGKNRKRSARQRSTPSCELRCVNCAGDHEARDPICEAKFIKQWRQAKAAWEKEGWGIEERLAATWISYFEKKSVPAHHLMQLLSPAHLPTQLPSPDHHQAQFL